MRRLTTSASLALLAVAWIACGSDVTIDPVGAGGAGGSPGKVGDPCSLASCEAGLFCDFPDDSCGDSGVSGVCTEPSMGASTDSPSTTCGCDGKIYAFWFEHQLAGFDRTSLDRCEAPAGQFHCGGVLCDDDGMSFCLYPSIDCSDGEGPRCETLPPNCIGSEDCGCFDAAATFCERREDGFFEVACL